jgi:hypothetical protein
VVKHRLAVVGGCAHRLIGVGGCLL